MSGRVAPPFDPVASLASSTDDSPAGAVVPALTRTHRPAVILTPAARKAIRQRMVRYPALSLERLRALTGVDERLLQEYRRDLAASDLPDTLVDRGASLAITRELPQAALLYLLVRATRPQRIVETGVRPGYSTAWMLAGLDHNRAGEMFSLGPGTGTGRVAGLDQLGVGQFVPPPLRARWTLVLGNSEERLRELLGGRREVDLFFSDNVLDQRRTHAELRLAWSALSPRGVLVAHRVEAHDAWAEFCRALGAPPQILDTGPPAMGALAVRGRRPG